MENKNCLHCRAEVPPETYLCAACDEIQRREQERQAICLDRNARRGAIERLPAWDWVDDDQKYLAAVKAPKLRAFADRYALLASAMVLGPTGIGKTASVNRALRRNIRSAARGCVPQIRWTTAAEVVATRLTHRFGESEPDLIRDVRRARVLVLDELGFERADPAFWVDVVDQRYSHDLVTITTSGATLDQLRERYGAAVVRKLVEPRGAIVEG